MPITLPKILEAVTDRIERGTSLDAVAKSLAGVVDRILPNGRFRDLASGTLAGHPAHPAIVAIPIGAWTAASYLDLIGEPTAARHLVGLGTAAAIPAALTGANDWLTTTDGEQRVGLVHALLNYTAIGLYGASWLVRRRDHDRVGAGLALAGAGVAGSAGWLGGHLSYAMGVGVDTTAFQRYPSEWTDAAADAEVVEGRALSIEIDGVPLLLTRLDGQVHALADRCTHRGGPLHEGPIEDGCITCPWHDSVFSLADGSVVRGPATRPQPTLLVRRVGAQLQVKREDEPRSLRNNPVGR
ncbi:MAG: hypothetical protein JWM76_407 [Pseudonocardiales bacterium]|nr:hypothetical protein [Pseudonocardiales bacterium]